MSDYRYQAIQPLITHQQVSGRTVSFTFTCPVTGRSVQARTAMGSAQPSMGSRMVGRGKRSVMSSLHMSLSRTLRGFFGNHTVGRMVSQAAAGALASAASAMGMSGPASGSVDIKAAAVEAFRGVSHQFTWERGRGWVGIRAPEQVLGPFQAQLQTGTISHDSDRKLLARMLVEVSMADGTLAPEEQAFLEEFIPSEIGTVRALAEQPPLTTAELAKCSKGPVRLSLLTLAWVIALADTSFEPTERVKLDTFAKGLGLSASQQSSAHTMARGYLLDQALEQVQATGGDVKARQAFQNLATRLGLTLKEAAEVEAAFLQRRSRP